MTPARRQPSSPVVRPGAPAPARCRRGPPGSGSRARRGRAALGPGVPALGRVGAPRGAGRATRRRRGGPQEDPRPVAGDGDVETADSAPERGGGRGDRDRAPVTVHELDDLVEDGADRRVVEEVRVVDEDEQVGVVRPETDEPLDAVRAERLAPGRTRVRPRGGRDEDDGCAARAGRPGDGPQGRRPAGPRRTGDDEPSPVPVRATSPRARPVRRPPRASRVRHPAGRRGAPGPAAGGRPTDATAARGPGRASAATRGGRAGVACTTCTSRASRTLSPRPGPAPVAAVPRGKPEQGDVEQVSGSEEEDLSAERRPPRAQEVPAPGDGAGQPGAAGVADEAAETVGRGDRGRAGRRRPRAARTRRRRAPGGRPGAGRRSRSPGG